ncbi:hypothetical protein L0F63_002396 [Massospora cicadina]|nr:hypothetical protein L0F63_002396 [Massospora cicadina]
MQATRRPSASELNLEEILLSVADSDPPTHNLPTQPTGATYPRPLPTPPPRTQPTLPSLPSHPTQDEFYPNFGYQHPPPNFTQDAVQTPYDFTNFTQDAVQTPYDFTPYIYESDTGAYQYAPHNVAYYNQGMYAHLEAYPYPMEPGYGEYYPEYGYYTHQPHALANSEPYRPYPYPIYDPPYAHYNQPYYLDEPSSPSRPPDPQTTSTPKARPLPRLPPKRRREMPDTNPNLNTGVPPPQPSPHSELPPQTQAVRDVSTEALDDFDPNPPSTETLDDFDPNPPPRDAQPNPTERAQNFLPRRREVHPNPADNSHLGPTSPKLPSSPQFRQPDTHPNQPDVSPVGVAGDALTSSQENLAALMADITLHLADSTTVDFKAKEVAPPGPRRGPVTPTPVRRAPDCPSYVTSHLKLAPEPPSPPPRLSKAAAALRLRGGQRNTSNPATIDPGTQDPPSLPSTASPPVTNPHNFGKVTKQVSRTSTGRLPKRAPTRVVPTSRPPSSIQTVSASRPVTDSGADGFDFDEGDFEPIDRAVKALAVPADVALDCLVRDHLVPHLNCDWERFRAIFVWVVANIRYDSPLPAPSPSPRSSAGEESGDEGSAQRSGGVSVLEEGGGYLETPQAVFLRRACRQFGFANLFRAMSTLAGIECEVIEGFLKGLLPPASFNTFRLPKTNPDPNDASELGKSPEANHAWVGVKIQGYYRLIDCGLATPTHPYNLHRAADPFYFLTNPIKLIFTHFPLNLAHQYLKPPVAFASFARLPFVTGAYFDYGVRFLDLPDGVLTIHEDQTGELNLAVPDGVRCWAEVEVPDPDPSGRGVRRLAPLVQCLTREGGRVAKVMLRIRGRAPSALLRFRCGYAQGIKALTHCFTLRLAHTGTKAPEAFVKLLPSPDEFFIVVPLNFELLYNIAYRFHVLPGSAEGRHYKLALRSPSMKVHKFVYYPGDQGYVANVTLRERGQWAISYLWQSRGERPAKRDPWINVACYRCI